MNVKRLVFETLKHRFVGHPKITFGVVERHVAFVAEEEMNLRPRNSGTKRGISRQKRVQTLWRRAAGQRNRKYATPRHDIFCQADKAPRRRSGQRARIGKYLGELLLLFHLNTALMLGRVSIQAPEGRAPSRPFV